MDFICIYLAHWSISPKRRFHQKEYFYSLNDQLKPMWCPFCVGFLSLHGSLSLCRLKILKCEAPKTPYGLEFSPFEYFNQSCVLALSVCASAGETALKLHTDHLPRGSCRHIRHSIRSVCLAYRPCRATLDQSLIVAHTSTEIYLKGALAGWVCEPVL